MSGTSMDGIDAALIETDGALYIRELGDVSIPYSPQVKILLKAAEYSVRIHEGDVAKAAAFYLQALQDYLTKELGFSEKSSHSKIQELSQYLKGNQALSLDGVIQLSTDLHAQAVYKLLEKTGYKADQIDVVGYHGQALFHQPFHGVSIIVGNGQNLANQIGILVINNFRENDIKAGGQGAPFAPLYHQALGNRDQKIPLVVVNCGGIANVSVISTSNELDLIGFDTGPGNGLIDRLVRRRTKGTESMDQDGRYGSKGAINEKAFKALYEKSIIKNGQNYFLKKPPKALDIGDLQLVEELDALSLEDACRTLAAFTADTIVQSLDLVEEETPRNCILAGGGWHNPVILGELTQRLKKKLGPGISIATASQAGWNTQALEAQIFAYLAVRSLQNKPLTFPRTTGTNVPTTGGNVYCPVNTKGIPLSSFQLTYG